MNPRAITGIGVASALGTGRAAFLESMRGGAKASATDGRAEVPGFDPTKYLGDKGLRGLDRLTKLLIVAAREALHDAGLKKDGSWSARGGDDVGIVVSNAYGSLEAITELDRVSILEDARYINPSRFPLTVANSAAGYASIWEDIRAANVSVSDGNCGGLDAAACADVLLAQKRARAVLVCGAEAMSDALHLAFQRLGAVGSRAERAQTDTKAFLGEGAAVLVLEPSELARERSTDVMAELVGYGTGFEAPPRESSLLHASSDALQRAIAEALSDAGVSPADVDVVVSGVSGLRVFDEAELVAIGRALGSDRCVLAPKLALGETLGGGGTFGMLSALAVLREAPRAPTPYAVRGALRTAPRTALVTSMGYYGNASAVVMRAAAR
ncbi:MAG TPA: beta-ketoacyl synthase N-terminal-like domain-containing protein [Polyangiaceae bacterium]|nr:beta-ketoacyl synthase N-terminal-like domain-containing protein [Polyangiaceae bacterium]